MPEQQITPFKIQQGKSKNHKIVKVHQVANMQAGFGFLDQSKGENAKQYHVVHRKVRHVATYRGKPLMD